MTAQDCIQFVRRAFEEAGFATNEFSVDAGGDVFWECTVIWNVSNVLVIKQKLPGDFHVFTGRDLECSSEVDLSLFLEFRVGRERKAFEELSEEDCQNLKGVVQQYIFGQE